VTDQLDRYGYIGRQTQNDFTWNARKTKRLSSFSCYCHQYTDKYGGFLVISNLSLTDYTEQHLFFEGSLKIITSELLSIAENRFSIYSMRGPMAGRKKFVRHFVILLKAIRSSDAKPARFERRT
jgi:hypothetical protein